MGMLGDAGWPVTGLSSCLGRRREELGLLARDGSEGSGWAGGEGGDWSRRPSHGGTVTSAPGSLFLGPREATQAELVEKHGTRVETWMERVHLAAADTSHATAAHLGREPRGRRERVSLRSREPLAAARPLVGRGLPVAVTPPSSQRHLQGPFLESALRVRGFPACQG